MQHSAPPQAEILHIIGSYWQRDSRADRRQHRQVSAERPANWSKTSTVRRFYSRATPASVWPGYPPTEAGA